MSSSDDDRISTPLAWGHASIVVSTIFVALRFFSRGYLLGVIGRPTDWVIGFSLLLSIAYTVAMTIQVRAGYGLHVWEVDPEQLTVFFQMAYVSLLLYGLAIIATKISILLLFLDVFNTTCLRRTAYVVFVIVVMHGIWITFSNAFFCTPVSAFWDFDQPRDRCFPFIKWFIEMWIHIALDFVIFLLPIPVIRSMTLPRRQKFWLYFVFALGFFVCLVATIRLYYMYHISISSDPTYDGMVVVILCFIELNLSIAIPCLITLKPLVDKIFPRLLVRKASSNRFNFDGSPAEPGDSVHPPTISSPPRQIHRDMEMQDV